MFAPALVASARSSSSDSSELKSGESAGRVDDNDDDEAATLVAWSRAAWAPAVRLAECFFAVRPWLRNSTPTRNARSCRSDGFSTAFGSFRELFRELPRLLSLESSRCKQSHFILQCRQVGSESKPLLETPRLTLRPRGCGLRAR